MKKIIIPLSLFILGVSSVSAAEVQSLTANQINNIYAHPEIVRCVKEEGKTKEVCLKEFKARNVQKFKAERKNIATAKKALIQDATTTRKDFRAETAELRGEYKERLEAATTPEEKKAILEEAKAARAERATVAKETRQAFIERYRDIAKKRTDIYIERFFAVTERARKINERINNKIAELGEKTGLDFSKAKDVKVEAVKAYQDAEAKVKEAKTYFDKALEAETKEDFRKNIKKGKELLKSAKEDLKRSYSKIRETVKIIKEILKEANLSNNGDEKVSGDDATDGDENEDKGGDTDDNNEDKDEGEESN